MGALAATVIGAAAVSASDDADKAKQSAEEEAKRLIALEKEQTLQKERASRKASERGRIRAEATISLQQALDSLEPIIRKEGNLAFDFDGIRNFAGNTIRAPRSPFSKSVKLLGFKADDKVLQRLGKLESMGYFEKLAASEALLTDLAHIITLENEITALERIERRIETINENGNA
ncbi:hypothetical protein Pnap_2749 [Polaromonas naphthalenivorans CJ2]|uniref:Uncharacterized protein n=1 Tax=Polaromonas naphthalenivorans (strain CJ2) TaxID=365044 RepID=A1VQX3_POLNA|nr:hypothetical protein Pnap_2749 [Polaromonas naphthalenivorans CJ2]